MFATITIHGLVDQLLRVEALRVQQKYIMQHGAEQGLEEFAREQAYINLTTLN